jgi:hypothetical protein
LRFWCVNTGHKINLHSDTHFSIRAKFNENLLLELNNVGESPIWFNHFIMPVQLSTDTQPVLYLWHLHVINLTFQNTMHITVIHSWINHITLLPRTMLSHDTASKRTSLQNWHETNGTGSRNLLLIKTGQHAYNWGCNTDSS